MLISNGLQIGPINVASDSLLLPILIIGIVYVPYVARPIRGQVLSLRRSEFVLAARLPWRAGWAHPAARHPAERDDHGHRFRCR